MAAWMIAFLRAWASLFRGVGDGLGLQRLEFGGGLGSQPRIVFLALRTSRTPRAA
jgi:hypothetical protein